MVGFGASVAACVGGASDLCGVVVLVVWPVWCGVCVVFGVVVCGGVVWCGDCGRGDAADVGAG